MRNIRYYAGAKLRSKYKNGRTAGGYSKIRNPNIEIRHPGVVAGVWSPMSFRKQILITKTQNSKVGWTGLFYDLSSIVSSGSALVVNPWGQIVSIGKTVGEEIVTATIPIAEFRTDRNRFDPRFKNPHMTPTTARGGVRTDLIAPVYQQHPAQFPPNLLTKYRQEHNGELPPDYQTTREWYLKNARWELQYQDLPA